jgi:hypothetical protein
MASDTRGMRSGAGSNGTTLDAVATTRDPTHGANPTCGTQAQGAGIPSRMTR